MPQTRARLRVLAYAGAMLITGSINTIAVKFQDLAVVDVRPDGSAILFQHPAMQSLFMFIGESLCLIPYFLLRWRRRVIKAQQGIPSKPAPPTSFFIKRTLAFAVPTLCDATATTLLNVGLFYTFASTYQMLRGTLVLFTGFFTVLIIRRSLYLHHWLGMVLIMAGAAIVGAASILCPNTPTPAPGPAHSTATTLGDLYSDMQSDSGTYGSGAEGAVTGMVSLHWPGLYTAWDRLGVRHASLCKALPPSASGPLFGNAMVVLAQAFTALQFILEEKFLGTYRVQPLLAVGIEGAWGVALCVLALPILSLIHTKDGLPVDDAGAAIEAMWQVPSLRYAVMVSICSIGLFNFFGLSVTAALSGASRATIDACRTILVWAFSLMAGWESFKQLQVVGFLVLLSGTSLYNELLRSCLPHAPRYRRVRTADDVDSDSGMGDEEGSCSDGALSDDEGPESETYTGPSVTAVVHNGGDEEHGLLVKTIEVTPDGLKQTQPRSGTGIQRPSGGLSAALAGSGAGPSTRSGGQGLREPLLQGAGSGTAPQRPPRDRTHRGGQRQSNAQRIAQQGGHHHNPHYTMARSMRLGFNALSPHDLADDDDGSLVAAEASDVADPMMLASTPYYTGPSGPGLRAMISDGVSTTSGASPRQSVSDLDDHHHWATHNTGGAGSSARSSGLVSGGAPSFSNMAPTVAGAAAAAAAGSGAAASAAPATPTTAAGSGSGGGAGGEGSSSLLAAALAAQRGRPVEPPPQGGFLAFMAARAKEQQEKDATDQAGKQ